METLREKANKYAMNNNSGYSDSQSSGLRDGYIAGYNEANKWISVEEELPPCSYKDILVKGYDIDGNVTYGIAYMHGTNAGIPDKNNFIVSEYINIVTHWRPID